MKPSSLPGQPCSHSSISWHHLRTLQQAAMLCLPGVGGNGRYGLLRCEVLAAAPLPCCHGITVGKGCEELRLHCRQAKGPDGQPVYEPCAPSERGAVEATLTQLAEKGLASQVARHFAPSVHCLSLKACAVSHAAHDWSCQTMCWVRIH